VAGSSAGLRVLVVDDTDEIRVLVHRALSNCGYEVDVAATLAQARTMDPAGYDAVLVDAHLGHERGIDLVDELRSQDPAAAGRCLVMTGGSAGALPEGLPWLAKPFQLGELVDAVRRLHHGDPGAASDPQPGASPDSGGVHRAASVLPGSSQPAAGEPPAWQLLGIARQLRARERRELVDFLHDGPIQELTAVTLELQMMSRSQHPADRRLDEVLRQLDAAGRSLRWLVDGNWPFVTAEIRLAAALRQRTAWLLAAPVTVETDEQPARLGALEVPMIVDVVELMLMGMVPDEGPARAHVCVRTQERLIRIELTLTAAAGDGQSIGEPAAARASLDRLASALGASATATLCEQHWEARIVLRRQHAAD